MLDFAPLTHSELNNRHEKAITALVYTALNLKTAQDFEYDFDRLREFADEANAYLDAAAQRCGLTA